MSKAPKDGKTRYENIVTQPLKGNRVFNNPEVVAQGWLPVCKSIKIPRGKAASFLLTRQRIVVYRGMNGIPFALDAFCPHMGADLGNGRVVGDTLQCYFHHWKFSSKGSLVGTKCKNAPESVGIRSWPVEEKYGFIWVFPAKNAPYPVPSPFGLEGRDTISCYLGKVKLFAHHHVMIVGGIDLQHFSTVHNIDIDFKLKSKLDEHKASWRLDGVVERKGVRGRLMHFFFGGKLNYHANIAGGSWISITYAPDLKFNFIQKKVPPLHVVWGCVGSESGVSDVNIFLVTEKYKGWRVIKSWFKLLLTTGLLFILKDDDIKAFPYMRFNIGHLSQEDYSVRRMVRFLNGLPLSHWSSSEDELL